MISILGEPIKPFEPGRTGRRRRQQVPHLSYIDDHGHKGLRVQFHLQGLRNRALGEIDAREVSISDRALKSNSHKIFLHSRFCILESKGCLISVRMK